MIYLLLVFLVLLAMRFYHIIISLLPFPLLTVAISDFANMACIVLLHAIVFGKSTGHLTCPLQEITNVALL
jgi:hypothetical protein